LYSQEVHYLKVPYYEVAFNRFSNMQERK